MDMNVYQRRASNTAIYPDAGFGSTGGLTYTALGLAGEAGEFANKVKKIHRDHQSDEEGMVLELGDVLWYVAQAASELGYDLADIAKINLRKLELRREAGKLGGSGDGR